MTAEPSPRHLDANGGRLYYEVRGSGPVLFVIGQPMTSGPLGPLADLLADDHTVVTYDPHGVGKSTVADPTLDVTPEIEADDLAAIVDDLGAERADIFGTSGGAVAGLAFAAHHSEKLGTLIAHEPPVTELLADASHIRAVVDDIQDSYRAAGAGPAWGKFVSMVVYDGPLTEPSVPPVSWPPRGGGEAQDDAQSADAAAADGAVEPADELPRGGDAAAGGGETQDQPGSNASATADGETEERHSGSGGPSERSEKDQADDELFFLRMLKPFTGYDVPVETLRTGRPRIVVAVGAASGGQIAARSAQALAEGLGTPAEVFPGDHGGFMADPAGFATAIREVLGKS